ncbi:DNA internalization-related competence protein ComEC/Rec2 [Natranaerobius trueperi]|uniref:DNA internalization-related competence protein ComEC/Rec2 n=1 Tax=Natranaerobius trueperi TaxID=759412 RepID=A0A226BVY5_9FIRM|nr:DNA internalization-related competence protein ComEC/Rec2 [Natranaerobius trueperi]OWZ83135.1 DNA internalization-related competence protein ComEC/Rec2 [Natranaerobius trueperi]
MCFVLLLIVNFFAFIYKNKVISPQLEDKEKAFVGKILKQPQKGERSVHYTVNITELEGYDLRLPIRIRMSILKEDDSIELFPGNIIEGKGRFVFPEPKRNPGGFDYEKFLKGRGKHLILYPNHVAKVGSSVSISTPGSYIANYLETVYLTELTSEVSPWVVALTLGNLSYLDNEELNILSDAGARHLTAVSGMHINILAFGVLSILENRKLSKKLSITIVLIVVFLYASAAGFSPSVIRASIMISIILLFSLTDKKFNPIIGLILSFLLLISFFPYLVLNVGFQLSYTATFFIIYLYPHIKGKRSNIVSNIIEPIKVASCAQIGIFPLILYHFGWISLGSLILAPLIAFILPLLLISILLFGLISSISFVTLPILVFIELSMRYVIFTVNLVSDISPSIWGAWSLLQVICYYVIVVALVYLKSLPIVFKPIKLVPLITLACTIILVFSFLLPFSKNLEIFYLDVGQGDASVIFTPDKQTILVDGGGVTQYMNASDPGEVVLLPFFQNKGRKEIDLLVITHPHIDHYGGLFKILEEMTVSKVMIPKIAEHEVEKEYLNLLKVIKQDNIPITYITDPMNVSFDEVSIDVLHPTSPYINNSRCDLNNNSIVMHLNYKDISLMFSGDLEKEGEARLLENFNDIESQVLKVGHHGSNSSTTKPFLSAVDPKIAVISSGRNNFYGHPSEEVLKRIENSNIAVFRTDKNGAVLIESDGSFLGIRTYLP